MNNNNNNSTGINWKYVDKLSVEVLEEAGYWPAMVGLSLNKFQPVGNMLGVAKKLAPLGNGHNKFLRQIQVWLQVKLPKKLWVELDTYKVGTVRQSSSTMHRPDQHFEYSKGTTKEAIDNHINCFKRYKEGQISISEFKDNIPDGLMLESVLSLNYANLRDIIKQRKTHRLPEWQMLIEEVLRQVEHPEFLGEK